MAHVIRCEQSTIADLKTVLKDFSVNMGKKEFRKMVRNTKKREELCRENFKILNVCWKINDQVLAIH